MAPRRTPIPANDAKANAFAMFGDGARVTLRGSFPCVEAAGDVQKHSEFAVFWRCWRFWGACWGSFGAPARTVV